MSSTTSSRPVSITIRSTAPSDPSCEPISSAALDCCALGAGPIDVAEAEHLAVRLKALSSGENESP